MFTQAQPHFTDKWVAALYGPVILQQSDPVYLGATVHTNNTAELTAIGEACHWLLRVCCNERYPHRPKEATICYDSEYAFHLATRLATPQTNAILAESVDSKLPCLVGMLEDTLASTATK